MELYQPEQAAVSFGEGEASVEPAEPSIARLEPNRNNEEPAMLASPKQQDPCIFQGDASHSSVSSGEAAVTFLLVGQEANRTQGRGLHRTVPSQIAMAVEQDNTNNTQGEPFDGTMSAEIDKTQLHVDPATLPLEPIPLAVVPAQPFTSHSVDLAMYNSYRPQMQELPKKRGRGRPRLSAEEKGQRKMNYRQAYNDPRRTLHVDVDIHNRLLEMKVKLNADTFNDVLFILLESFALTMETSEEEPREMKQEFETQPTATEDEGISAGSDRRDFVDIPSVSERSKESDSPEDHLDFVDIPSVSGRSKESDSPEDHFDFVDIPSVSGRSKERVSPEDHKDFVDIPSVSGRSKESDSPEDHLHSVTYASTSPSSSIGAPPETCVHVPETYQSQRTDELENVQRSRTEAILEEIQEKAKRRDRLADQIERTDVPGTAQRTRAETILDELRKKAKQRDRLKNDVNSNMPVVKQEIEDASEGTEMVVDNVKMEEEEYPEYDPMEDDLSSANEESSEDYNPEDDEEDSEEYEPTPSKKKAVTKSKKSQSKKSREATTKGGGDVGEKMQKRQKRKPKSPKVNWKLLPSKLKCRVCKEICDELTDMRQHILEKHSQQTVSKPKSQKDNLVKAKMMRKKNELLTISDFEVSKLSQVMRLCPFCNEYIDEVFPLIGKHMNDHGPKTQMCEWCGACFRDTATLHGHMRICKNRPGKADKYPCSQCGKMYASHGAMRIHVRHVHLELSTPVVCEVCGKELSRSANLRTHMATHFSVKPFECPDCGKGFSQKSNMQYHRRVHTGEKPYKCDVCPEAFSHNVSLKTHKKKTHGIDMWANNDQT